MKTLKLFFAFIFPILLLISCSKGNEHITRDLVTAAVPVGFTFPVITDASTNTTITEVKGSTNLDSLISAATNSEFNIGDIRSIKISALRLDVANTDTTYNFRLLENLTVKLKSRTGVSNELAKVNTNFDFIAPSLIVPITGPEEELKDIFNGGNYTYELSGKVRRTTPVSFKATLTAQYRVTLAK